MADHATTTTAKPADAGKSTDPAKPEPITMEPPKPPTPLDPPVIYYNQKWKVPPIIVHTQEEADVLDPAEWTPNPPPKEPDPQYPKLYYNVNVAPQIISDAAEEKALSGDWREFSLPDSLCKAAEAANAAKAKAAAAKQTPGNSGTQGQPHKSAPR